MNGGQTDVTQLTEIGESNMGAEARGTENTTHRRNLTNNFICSPSVEKCSGYYKL